VPYVAEKLSAVQTYVVQENFVRNSEVSVWVAMVTKISTEEKVLKSAWHAMIALVGVYELRNHKTRASKVLACGLIAFHADAAINDILGKPTALQRLLGRLRK
jgi:hypothetical protein